MHRFKLLETEVRAVQIDDGSVELDTDRAIIGDVWLVVDSKGERTVWNDREFRACFEPADDAAGAYLETRPVKP